MDLRNQIHFWSFTKDYWFEKLHSGELGLMRPEVELGIKLKSLNIRKKSNFKSNLILFFKQYKNPLMLLLIVAIFLSFFLGDSTDGLIILLIVLTSGILSFSQERKAKLIVKKLQDLISVKCNVKRNGVIVEIPNSEIQSGDLLIFHAGDLVPADCLVIFSNEMHSNEASITGESFPVRKISGIIDENSELSKRINCLWEGSSIVSGDGIALAINTGENTLYGKISKSASKDVETEFEKNINEFGFFLMRITIFLSMFILFVNLIEHKGVIESALFALALAVGMAPELLPAITTIAMSEGASRLLKKKVIVKKLSSIQNLGEINLLCTDKTGTITEGNINVFSVIDSEGHSSEYVKNQVYWNAFFETGYINPIDIAIRNFKIENKLNLKKISEIPYDFNRKRVSILISNGIENTIISKGAFDQIINICNKVRLSDGSVEDIKNYSSILKRSYEKFGIDGFRTIGVCEKIFNKNCISVENEIDMIFIGFALLNDSIKEGIINTIEELNNLHVELKIITGDNQNVARSIANSIGIKDSKILTGKELTLMSSEALVNKVKDTVIFAEIEPLQKELIILSLRKSFTVAYLGDGINDVAAINAADVGISVENAVDIARSSADIVLLEKDLMVLIEGIKEGRKTFANTLKYILINTGSTFGNMFSVAIASLFLPFLPMLPKQILLTNFITDFPYLSIASDNVDKEQILKPGKWDLKLIRNFMILFGIHSSLFDLLTYWVLLKIVKAPEGRFQTAWFIESILTELFILFIIRTRINFFKSKPSKSLFKLSVLACMITLILPYSAFAQKIGLMPMPLINILFIIIIVFLYVLTADYLKVWFFNSRTFRTR